MIVEKENTISLHLLKDLAAKCIHLNLLAIAFYLGILIFLDASPGVAVSCGLLAILVSLTPAIYAFQKRKITLLLSGISIVNLAPIWFLYLESVLPGYDAYTYIQPEVRIQAFLWVSVFQLLVNLIYLLCWDNTRVASIRHFSFIRVVRPTPLFYTRLTAGVFFIPLLFFYFYYGSASQLWTALTGGRLEGSSGLLIRDSVGSASSFMLPLTWIWQLTPLFGSIAFVSARRQNKFSAAICLLMGLAVIFVFFLSGSRGSMIFVATPVLFFLFYYNWHRGARFWIPAMLLLGVLIAIMEIQVRFRGNLLDVLSNPEKAARSQGLKSATTFDPTQSQRDNNMYLFCLMVKSYPEKYAYEGFNDFFAVLVNPVPRSLWKNKPVLKGAEDIDAQSAFVLSGPLTMGTTSLSFSIVGDAYKTAGLPGLLIYALIYGLFILYFDGILYYVRKSNPMSIAILGMSLFLVFWGYRAFFALVSFLYPVILLLIFLKIMQKLRTR